MAETSNQDWLAALDAQIAAEDAADVQENARRHKAGLSELPRTIKTEPGWIEDGADPRML